MKLPAPEELWLPPAGAAAFLAAAADALARQPDPGRAWDALARAHLGLDVPFPAVLALWRAFQGLQDQARQGPLPAWVPRPAEAADTQVMALARARGLPDVPALQAWSAREREAFWGDVLERLAIPFATPPARVLSPGGDPRRPCWLPGARLNAAAACLRGDPQRLALRALRADGDVLELGLGELRAQVARVSAALQARGLAPGDAVAIVMPMTPEAVVAYLGAVAAGLVVVSIPDSFAAPEIATRLRLGQARLVFTQDALPRGPGEAPIPLHARVVAAGGPPAVVVGAGGARPAGLRGEDLAWEELLAARPAAPFEPLPADPGAFTNVLFSSGTTGEPKAIPWTHLTPLKAAADGHLLHDLRAGDVAAWPTNLGWMMGPWLIYAGLVNGAALALAEVPPGTRAYREWVGRAGVTMQGVVPTLVKTWRAQASGERPADQDGDWSRVRRFSSTGECSNPDDMLWLMWRAGWKPVLEYCGGTEVGGGYAGGTLAQPQAPACFSTPAFGLALRLLDEAGAPVPAGTAGIQAAGPGIQASGPGEVYLVPPSLGLSQELLGGRDHDEVYYAGCPTGPGGEVLRRHGDQAEALPGGFLRVHGRADDAMNLAGIKVGAAELERVMNAAPGVHQSAAVAIPEPGGGPSRLVAFVEPLPGVTLDPARLREELSARLRAELNPLFKLGAVRVVERLPRTPSNKVLRRQLRAELLRQEGS